MDKKQFNNMEQELDVLEYVKFVIARCIVLVQKNRLTESEQKAVSLRTKSISFYQKCGAQCRVVLEARDLLRFVTKLCH
jgi:hypothetical protein